MKGGFSLVELSIVLVILGLLTGGILAGQSLIRASELRSVSVDFKRYSAAAYTFRDKYFGWPGDFKDATKFWGSAGGTGADATCFSAQSQASVATCNGDGNGDSSTAAGVNSSERFMTWKHLANAGLIEGSYTGKTTGASGTYSILVGTNVPGSKVGAGSFFDMYAAAFNAGYAFTETIFPSQEITLYGDPANSYGALLPEEAWNIDTKLDDGSPVYGVVYSNKKTATVAPNCTSSDANDATYDLTVQGKNCLSHFRYR